MLSLTNLDVYIQTSHILRRISLDVGEREVVCLVGRNGAGKTTALRSIMGYLRPRAGQITFRGREIQSSRSFEIARMGLGFAPEDSGIFTDLTVAENIEISTWTRATDRPASERIEQAYRVFPALRRYMARKGPEKRPITTAQTPQRVKNLWPFSSSLGWSFSGHIAWIFSW